MVRIDWLEYEDREHVLAWFLTEVMSAAGMEQFGDFDSSALEVELKVNGIAVPITGPMEFLQSQLDALREEGRQQGLRDAVQQITDNMAKVLHVED